MNDVGRLCMLCALSLALGACVQDGAPSRTLSICHQDPAGAQIVDIAAGDLPAHVAHGDYVARLVVDPAQPLIGDGVHFARITDAVAAARAGRIGRNEFRDAACRITIDVAAGTYRGSLDSGAAPSLEQFPIIVDVPRVTLRGALQLALDGEGRPTGAASDDLAVTTLTPDRLLADAPLAEGMMAIVGHPGGPGGDGAEIEGFSFRGRSTEGDVTGGTGIFSLRVERVVVRGNRFEAKLTTALAFQATNARIERNYATGLGFNCTFCLVGPGQYDVAGNRFVNGDLGGVYLAATGGGPFSPGARPAAPIEPYVAPQSAAMSAAVENNDFQGHVRQPIGFGVRVAARGSGPPSVPQALSVSVSRNDFARNTFALIVDAGFPDASSTIGADLDVSLRGNRFGGSCQNDLLVGFMRHQGALGLATNAPVRNATYRIATGGDLAWGAAWYNNPAGFGNVLVVDDVVVPPGVRVAYDPLRTCSR